ncbi:hypothetical protein M0R45_001277 [Rubus argutus]|uniref:RING-type E3 ubiquitin transferase n=1 Tax=Rubus argutus TaxID=59490 RepID=A0AAW1VI53_RUBAR
MGSKHRKLLDGDCYDQVSGSFTSGCLRVALLVCGYFLYVRYYKNRRTRSSSQPQQPPLPDLHQHHHAEFIDEEHGPIVDHPIWYIRTVGLQQSLISSITVCQYKKGDGLVEGTECAVCLNEFQEDETLRLLPKCDHAFHVPSAATRTNIVDSSQPEEETQVEMLENTGESSTTGGVENEIGETRTEAGEDTIDKQICIYQEPRRRSVSIDSSSASKISLALSNVIAAESERYFFKREITANGKQTLKRSSSCNGKLLLCMDIDNCDSVFPLRSF